MKKSEEFQRKQEENQRADEERTAKKRAARQKKKVRRLLLRWRGAREAGREGAGCAVLEQRGWDRCRCAHVPAGPDLLRGVVVCCAAPACCLPPAAGRESLPCMPLSRTAPALGGAGQAEGQEAEAGGRGRRRGASRRAAGRRRRGGRRRRQRQRGGGWQGGGGRPGLICAAWGSFLLLLFPQQMPLPCDKDSCARCSCSFHYTFLYNTLALRHFLHRM